MREPFKPPVPGGRTDEPRRRSKRVAALVGWGLLLSLSLTLVVFLDPTLKVGLPFLKRTTHEVADLGKSSEAQGAAEPPRAEQTPAAAAAPAARSEESTPLKMKKATGEQPAKQRKSSLLNKAAAAATCLS